MIEVPGLRSTPSNRSHRLLTRVFPGSSLIVVLPVFRVVVVGILACGCDGLFEVARVGACSMGPGTFGRWDNVDLGRATARLHRAASRRTPCATGQVDRPNR